MFGISNDNISTNAILLNTLIFDLVSALHT